MVEVEQKLCLDCNTEMVGVIRKWVAVVTSPSIEVVRVNNLNDPDVVVGHICPGVALILEVMNLRVETLNEIDEINAREKKLDA